MSWVNHDDRKSGTLISGGWLVYICECKGKSTNPPMIMNVAIKNHSEHSRNKKIYIFIVCLFIVIKESMTSCSSGSCDDWLQYTTYYFNISLIRTRRMSLLSNIFKTAYFLNSNENLIHDKKLIQRLFWGKP